MPELAHSTIELDAPTAAEFFRQTPFEFAETSLGSIVTGAQEQAAQRAYGIGRPVSKNAELLAGNFEP